MTNAAPVEVEVFVSIGSNVRPQENLRRAHEALSGAYGELQSSRVYQSQAVGFEGDDFLNMVIGFSTTDEPEKIVEKLEEVHETAKRERQENPFSSRTLDLDLLLYGDLVRQRLKLPREDIEKYGFVLGPLAEVAPALRHPVSGLTMREIWDDFDHRAHPMRKVPVRLRLD